MTRDVPIPRAAAADWADLTRPAAATPAGGPGELPAAAGRWLAHATPAGSPPRSVAELRMEGEIRLGGRWHPFTARQVIAPGRGFVWAARARVGRLPVTGFDRYTGDGGGEMRWRLLGLVPVMGSTGPDTTRSAAGRLAAESVFVPPACTAVPWSEGPDDDTAVMSWDLHGEPEQVQLRVGRDGRLLEVTVPRWGDPDGAGFGRHPFGVTVEEEAELGGLRVPGVLRAGWWWGTDRQDEGEFFRARVTSADFR